MHSGRKNLILLGLSAFLITVVATTIELYIYRSSGDIYLDRSRPGYLPDETEAEEETEVKSSYTYSDTGALDRKELDEYLKELKSIEKHLDQLPDPYSPEPLSDESLGIVESTNSDTEAAESETSDASD